VSAPKLCERCGIKPQAYHDRRWCCDCKPGSKGRPRPCRRCGSTGDYWAERLCRRCHQYAPQRPEPCQDCLAWGARRTQKWLCEACVGWRAWHPGAPSACVSCHDVRAVNEHSACRLCWKQAKLDQPRLRSRHRGPLNIIGANAGGQQLFLANMGSSKNGYRPPAPRAATTPRPAAPRSRRRAHMQLDLLTRDPVIDAARRYGFPDPPNARLAYQLDKLAQDHAAEHGWRGAKTHKVRTGIRVLLGMPAASDLPFRASDVTLLTQLELPAASVLTVLRRAGIAHDDRPTTIETWFHRQVHDLPEPMTTELQTWFTVLHHGSTTPPRSRPRAPGTINTRLRWALPTLRSWSTTGHTSLREITREDILAVLPATGTPRVKLGGALRSIFTTLKAHKLIFTNPTARIRIGNFERRTPLPASQPRLHDALNTTDPTGAAIAGLLVFHGLRPIEVRQLRLTDIHDGRLHLPNRTIPLASPARTRLRTYLDYRASRWPTTINPHLLINDFNAGATNAPSRSWVNDRLGMPAQRIRQDRIVDEAIATGGDLRRICDFFGVTMNTAEHYATVLSHPALETPSAQGSRTPAAD
jgi:hypothetical protein